MIIIRINIQPLKVAFLILLTLFNCEVDGGESVFNHFGEQLGFINDNIKIITEDQSGLIWIGTPSGLFKFNGLSFEKVDSSAVAEEINIKDLLVDDKSILVATNQHGMLRYSNNTLIKVKIHDVDTVNAVINGHKQQFWIATNSGVFQRSKDLTVQIHSSASLDFLRGKRVNTLEKLSDNTIAIVANHEIHFFHEQTENIDTLRLNDDVIVYELHEDRNDLLWIATSKELVLYDWKKRQKLPPIKLESATRILSIDEYKDDIWVATIAGGLYKVNSETIKVKQYLPNKSLSFSLAEKNFMAVHVTSNGMLWAGGFSTGLSGLDLKLSQFNFHTQSDSSLNCVNDAHIYSIKRDTSNTLWLGNSNGLIKWRHDSQNCELINFIANRNIKGFTVYDTQFDDNQLWVGSSLGLLQYELNTSQIRSASDYFDNTTVFFVHHKNNTNLLLGTSKGVFEYDKLLGYPEKLKVPSNKYSNISFRKIAHDNVGRTFFSTTEGVLQLGIDNQLHEFKALKNTFIDQEINSIVTNKNNHLFISTRKSGLYHLNENHELVHHYYKDLSDSRIHEMLPDSSDDVLWLGTDKGIVSLNLINHESLLYASEAGNSYLGLNKASYRDSDENLYFGGIGGFVNFKAGSIVDRPRLYPLKIDELFLKGAPVVPNTKTDSGFYLDQSIESTKDLAFGHKDKIIGFGFSQLNYNNPKDTKFFYRLGPESSEWIPLPQNERRVTFNSLKPGLYQLDIKSRYFTGESQQSLSFTVKAPPWLSWWAFLSYLLAAVAMVFIYVRRKVASEKKINAYLNQQVEEKTKHIASQKKTVEDLMARKNEIFSNVSHEFRTPITLILGPIEELQKTEKEAVKKDSFEMISRNAKRLLNLVNQMLKLAQISETDQTQRQLVDLSSSLNMIIEPFVYLAKKNEINLTVESVDEVKLSLTEDALETIITNFLSNAIKYTSIGGEVSIGTRRINNDVEIYVKDSGTGISQEDQQLVFKRFNRLHQDSTPGTGIGLALVKELADLNQAQLNLNSEIGQGSEFSVKFPVDTSLQNQTEIIEAVDLGAVENLDDQIMHNKQTVLIIDDNEDMRHYIKQVLSQHFNCMLAVDGLDGISTALKYVPDIIVCDVMMPDVDGFHVCRKLRGEIITCHIPLVLLTAVNEKSSRIKGWRENIDRYLNKPFDAQELVLQLKNILNTRQLLVNKAGESREPTNSYLSEIDQEFIDKLKRIIEEGYADPLFNLQKMARYMFVSDRQLQRKTKALISESPMDMVREIRLIKSAELLIKGQQISYVSDVCGFSSVSYFSRSFKNNYGMTPKAYQKLKHQ